jgi:hypothetical protein
MSENHAQYESEYLDEKLMSILPDLLTEVAKLQPKDPIDWLVSAIRRKDSAQA